MLFGADPPQTLRGTGLANPAPPLPSAPRGSQKDQREVGFTLDTAIRRSCVEGQASLPLRHVPCIVARLMPELNTRPPIARKRLSLTGTAQTLPCSHPPSKGSLLKGEFFLLTA
ncbi:MAG: hypothetical protein A2157_18285 [Deltaproteobacteria bacterium RBG_16_47_11]|nr:MAG: hypothetical protein A2157_18285 [Deltaproteobacteria bacterium RBG_16_47_11]